MIENFSKGKKHLLLVLCFLVFGACKQSEFYEKETLSQSAIGADSGGNGGGMLPGGSEGNSGGNAANGGSAGENGGSTAGGSADSNGGSTGGGSAGSNGGNTGSGSTGSNGGSTGSGSTGSNGGSTGGSSGSNVGNTGGGNTGSGSTGSNGGSNGGSGSNTPVVVTPPIKTPVVTPPVVVNPPVKVPVVVTPPVKEPVVVTPPIKTPVVVTPPVVTPPVVTPPVVTPPKVQIVLNERVENFTQNIGKQGDVDILWVVDDSGSMADKQDSLGRNFSVFINQFLDKEIDFKMAITTTDATSKRNGMMVGDSKLLTTAAAKKNKSAFISNFTKFVKVGTKGSASEQGLKTSASFMDRYASSFLRPDAFLVVVYLSDEEDQSGKNVSEYLTKLQSLKKNKGMFKAYSIVAVKGGLKHSWESVGARYAELSTASAGTTSDIRKDFSDVLLNMGGTIVNLIDSFALNETPFQDKVEVYVNGLRVDSGYTFNSASRSIKFDEKSLPREGSKIEIRYKVNVKVLGAK